MPHHHAVLSACAFPMEIEGVSNVVRGTNKSKECFGLGGIQSPGTGGIHSHSSTPDYTTERVHYGR